MMPMLPLFASGEIQTQAFIFKDAIGVTGAFIGVVNIPERWFPGTLDLIFNSHHLMHVMVVYAVYEMHKATSLDLRYLQLSHQDQDAAVRS